MLDAVGVTAYHTIVYGGEAIRDLQSDFSSTQGNHMILNVPTASGDDLWLECTSQSVPFGFIANFTDDRDVLVVTPEGGRIKHTKLYDALENKISKKADIIINPQGNMKASLSVHSSGMFYNERMAIVQRSERENLLRYKNEFGYIHDLNITSIDHQNNKEEASLAENLEFTSSRYIQKAGTNLIFAPNVFNRNQQIPVASPERVFPLSIQRSFSESDNYKIIVPDGMRVEGLPINISFVHDFGSYNISVELKNNSLYFKRALQINAGVYEPEAYEHYRKFIKSVVKSDKAKLVLTPN